MGVADDQLHAVEPAGFQRAQEVGPEGLGFRGPDAQTDDLAAALGVGGNGDYGRNLTIRPP